MAMPGACQPVATISAVEIVKESDRTVCLSPSIGAKGA